MPSVKIDYSPTQAYALIASPEELEQADIAFNTPTSARFAAAAKPQIARDDRQLALVVSIAAVVFLSAVAVVLLIKR